MSATRFAVPSTATPAVQRPPRTAADDRNQAQPGTSYPRISHGGTAEPTAAPADNAARDVLTVPSLSVVQIRSLPGRIDHRPITPAIPSGSTTLLVIRTGHATLWSPGGGPRRLTPADTTVITGDSAITFTTSQQFDGYVIAINTSSITTMGVWIPPVGIHRIDQSALSRAIVGLLQPLSGRPLSGRTVEALAVQRAVMDLAAGLLSALDNDPHHLARPHDAVLRAAATFIAANNGNPALSSAMIAAAAGVSNRQLQRVLAGAGTTVAGELMRSRLERAVAILSDAGGTAVPLQRVAEQVGFGSISRLRRAFATEYGMTPSSYRIAVNSGFSPEPRRSSAPNPDAN